MSSIAGDAESMCNLIHEERDSMNQVLHGVKTFLVSEDGPTAVEYAVMLALIVVVCIGTVRSIGTNANAKFNAAKAGLL